MACTVAAVSERADTPLVLRVSSGERGDSASGGFEWSTLRCDHCQLRRGLGFWNFCHGGILTED